jgi:hypothetical protein
MQTPFDLGVAFLEIFVASVMLLAILTATGQTERLLQTQTALTQQIDTQRQTSDLRRFHQAEIPYYEVLGAIHTHSEYDFPVIIASEEQWINSPYSYVDSFIAGVRNLTIPGVPPLIFTSTPADTIALNDVIRHRSPASLRFNARVLQDGSGAPIGILFTHP